jgi:hypothetical protein
VSTGDVECDAMRRERKGEEGERATSERTGASGRVGTGKTTRTYAGDGGDKRDFSHSTRAPMDCGLWIVQDLK